MSVVGARPNFMKVAPLHRAFAKKLDRFHHLIVHTGQHYDEKMSKVFFEELELPNPDFYLGVGSGSHAQQTAKIMMEFEKVVIQEQPDLVIVVGDVNSTVACSLTSVKLGIPVAHVEAGLRSFDRTMPEEINRLVTDAISDLLFVSEPSGLVNLRNEGVDENKVHFVGNVMIDSLIHYREKARSSNLLRELSLNGETFTLVTLHRPSNVDVKDRLEAIVAFFEALEDKTHIIFPIHPRTRKMLAEFGFTSRIEKVHSLKLMDPIGYLDFLALMERAALILTDSGGIQEETTFLGVPCLTLRESTERPVTIEVGTNELCGSDLQVALRKAKSILDGHSRSGKVPEKWDGHAAERIVEVLERTLV